LLCTQANAANAAMMTHRDSTMPTKLSTKVWPCWDVQRQRVIKTNWFASNGTLPQVLGQADRCLHGECIALRLQGLQLHGEYAQTQHIEHHQPSQGVKGGEPK
jgi:hypothetical protein